LILCQLPLAPQLILCPLLPLDESEVDVPEVDSDQMFVIPRVNKEDRESLNEMKNMRMIIIAATTASLIQ